MLAIQAMDRAHRIGQTKTVHVFRLIVKDSIEEVRGCYFVPSARFCVLEIDLSKEAVSLFLF